MRPRPGERWAALVVAALVAAGCASASDGSVASTATSGPGAPSGTTLQPGQGPGTTAGPVPTDAAGRPVTTRSGGGTATTTPGPPSVDGNVDVGQLARYILGDQSSRIVIEISAQDGAQPASGTVSHITSALKAASGKPVIVDGPAKLSGGSASWTGAQLRQLADTAARTPQGGGGAAVLRLLFLHGDFEGDDQVLGIAARGDVAAVFVDRVEASSDILTGPEVLEDAVTTHEVGHLLGLVDLVLTTGRHDPEHPGHSRSTGSVMYWAVESSLVTQLLQGGPPRDFDDADLADLRTIRGG